MTRRRAFLDTNVLVYAAHTSREFRRGECAKGLLRQLQSSGAAAISPQSITEFVNVGLRKLGDEVTPQQVLQSAHCIADMFAIIPLDALTTREALRACGRYGLGYLDAQIWAAARAGGCDAILTEDTHGEMIEGVRYVNPFAEGFDLEVFLCE